MNGPKLSSNSAISQFSPLEEASWIWLPVSGAGSDDGENQYVRFRTEFQSPSRKNTTCQLQISVDSDFVAFLNEQEIARGQFPDYPQEKTFGMYTFPAELLKGRNALCVLAYYRGSDFSTYRTGRAGLIARLVTDEIGISTGSDWKCRISEAFLSGPVPRTTVQLGFTVEYDARREDEWLSANYDASSWVRAEIRAGARNGYWRLLSERPVPPPGIGERCRVKTVVQGSDKYEPPFIINDCGEETAGLLDLEVDAPAGTILELSHGEHLADGRVRNRIGDRIFTDRYICREGHNAFLMPFRILGARYLQLSVSPGDAAISLHYLGLRPVFRQLPVAAPFACSETLSDRAETVSVRTLELCMRDHYEDCPWREQALYAYDSRSQALFGYYLWGNYDFAAASFSLLGRGMRDDGFLELCAPAKVPVTIPIFTYVWIVELTEHALHSGEDSLIDTFGPIVETVLDRILATRDTKNGLCRLPRGKPLWNFYEWAPLLDGPLLEGPTPVAAPVEEDEFHAPYDLYFLEALEAWCLALERRGSTEKAGRYEMEAAVLIRSVNRTYWDEERGVLATRIVGRKRQGYHVHTNCLALKTGALSPIPASRVEHAVISGSLHPSTFSSLPYLVNSLMARSPAARSHVARLLRESFDPMVLGGAATFWETPRGEAEFDGAGSLCHGWSAIPAYFHHAYVLGVRPIDPGFSCFLLAPYPAGHRFAKGSVPTPFGAIEVEWTESEGGMRLSVQGPESTRPVLRPYSEVPLSSATYNGVPLV